MSPLLTLDERQDQRLPRGLGGLFYGVYPAVVTDLKDPAGRGRVKVKLPWAPDSSGAYEVWARIATLMAGNNRGSWFIPDRDDEVLVAFDVQEVGVRVRAGIDRLPDSYREVLLLRDIEELDTEETAKLLGVSTNAVKTRLHRARQALREVLDPALRES